MNREIQPIQIVDSTPARCDKAKRDLIHAERNAEGPQGLTDLDFRLSQGALEFLGRVPKEDARKRIKEQKKQYKTGNENQKLIVENALEAAFEGFFFANHDLSEIKH